MGLGQSKIRPLSEHNVVDNAASSYVGRRAFARGNTIKTKMEQAGEAALETATLLEHTFTAATPWADSKDGNRRKRNTSIQQGKVKAKEEAAKKAFLEYERKDNWRLRTHSAFSRAHKVLSVYTVLQLSKTDKEFQCAYQLVHDIPALMSSLIEGGDADGFKTQWDELQEAFRAVAREQRTERRERLEKEMEAEREAQAIREKLASEYNALIAGREGEDSGDSDPPAPEPPRSGPGPSRLSSSTPQDLRKAVLDPIPPPATPSKKKLISPKAAKFQGEANNYGRAPSAPDLGLTKSRKNLKGRRKTAYASRRKFQQRKGGQWKRAASLIKLTNAVADSFGSAELDSTADYVEGLLQQMSRIDGGRAALTKSELTEAEVTAVVALRQLISQLNAINHRWVEEVSEWQMPEHVPLTNEAGARMSLVRGYDKEAVKALREGKVAIYLNTVDQLVPGHTNGSADAQPLFLLDPWTLENEGGGRGGGGEGEGDIRGQQLYGVTVGGRHLLQVARAITNAAGAEALAKTPLVLHVGVWFDREVVLDLIENGFYGFNQDLVVIIAAPRFHGYRFDSGNKTFRDDHSLDMVPLGEAYNFKQLTFAGEAKIVGEDGGLETLASSAADFLVNGGVHYLQYNRIDDPWRLTLDGALDLEVLGVAMRRHVEQKNNMFVETLETKLCAGYTKAGVALRPVAAAAGVWEGAGGGGVRERSCVVIKGDSLRATGVPKLLYDCMNEGETGTVSMPTGRYVLYLPILKTIIKTSALMPTLVLRARHAFPVLDLADISRLRGSNLAAIDGGGKPGQGLPIAPVRGSRAVRKQEDVHAFLSNVILPIDKDRAFMDFMAQVFDRAGVDPTNVQICMGNMARYKAVACVDDGPASMKAFALAERLLFAGVDRLHVINIVRSSADVPTGEKIAHIFKPRNVLLEIVRDCKLAIDGDLTEGIVQFCDQVECNLVVMGTMALTQGGSVGSFAMAGLKSLPYNYLIVKNSMALKPLPPPGVAADGLTFILYANMFSMGTLHFMLDFVVKGRDRVFIVHVNNEAGGQAEQRHAEAKKLMSAMEMHALMQGVRVNIHFSKPGETDAAKVLVNLARDVGGDSKP